MELEAVGEEKTLFSLAFFLVIASAAGEHDFTFLAVWTGIVSVSQQVKRLSGRKLWESR